jgi:hypothetical protein
MPALLKLIPLRDWCYIGAILVLLAGFGWYTHHERAVQHERDVAADAKAVHLQELHNRDVENAAQDAINEAVSRFTFNSAPVPLEPPRLVCHEAGGSAVRDHAGTPAASDGAVASAGVVPEESTVPFDPAPEVLGDARDADKVSAQAQLLQDYVRACQAAGLCRK